MNKSLTKHANMQLKNIHRLSRRYNKLLHRNHVETLLTLMKEHITEIQQRYKRSDEHYIVETGDLVILCLELLTETKVSLDKVLSECYKRYHKKLPHLINDLRRERRKNG